MIETLATEVDKKGSRVIVKRSKNLAFSPAYSFFIREKADLIDAGNGSSYTSWDDHECGIIWCEIDNVIVGIFSYNKSFVDRPVPFLAIQLTAVKSEYRERGIHTIMNKYFEQTAKEFGSEFIRATVNLNNSVRLASAKKDKLDPLYIVMTKRID